MSGIEKIPLVQREGFVSKNCKMVCTTAIIIILIIFYMCYQNTIIQTPNIYNSRIIQNMVINKSILGKYINLVTPNHKKIPIINIVIVDRDMNMISINLENSIQSTTQKGENQIQFVLNRPTHISHITLHLNIFGKHKEHILDTKVNILDTNRKIKWHNYEPLSVNKYIDVYMYKPPNSTYRQPQKIDSSVPDINQETLLSTHLINNTWN